MLGILRLVAHFVSASLSRSRCCRGTVEDMTKTRVLFVNTRSQLGADVAVHLTLIQNLNPEQVEVHIATNRNAVDLEKTLGILRAVPGLRIQALDLGHEISGQGRGKL